MADFGLSKVIWDNSTLTPCGTVGYTAPEIVRDQKYSKSVDMWAIGCVLYTILCGFPPFYDESIRALTHKVARGEYTFLSPWWDPISPAAKDLIRNLLTVDPEKRYTIEEFFKHPWITRSTFPPKQDQIDLIQKKKPNDPRTQAMQNAANKAQEQGRIQKQEDIMHELAANSAAHEQDKTKKKPTGKRTDLFSPGINSIKEILDITYAVQRMGEEKKKKAQPGQEELTQPAFAPGGYDSISEEEEDEEEEEEEKTKETKRHSHGIDREVIAMAEQMVHDGKGIAPAAFTVSPEQKQQTQQTHMITPTSRRRRNMFELDLTKATLLKNRRMAPVEN